MKQGTDHGWIKLHRQLMKNKFYFSEAFTKSSAWIDLLLLANHDEKFFFVRGVRVDIQRGQVGLCEDTLANRWQWSRGKVRRFLLVLQNEKQIVQQKSNVTTLISILNYNNYQSDSTPNSTANNPLKSVPVLNIPFTEFWDAYGKKVGSTEKISRKWAALKDSDRVSIMAYLPRYTTAQPDKKFRKNPDTFLNNKSWLDEIVGEIIAPARPMQAIENNEW